MSGIELAVGWLAVQVSLALIPAIFLHLWASRRGPVQGAWVAVASLAMVLALSVAVACPRPRVRPFEPRSSAFVRAGGDVALEQPTAPIGRAGGAVSADGSDSIRRGLTLSDASFARWIENLRTQAGRSASRYPRGAGVLTCLIVGGVAAGLIRLMVGLWGIGLCRRRGMPIEDPELLGLLEKLRVGMGCRSKVELYEVPDLGTAATAGWRRPLILLPDDWRSWDLGERRAVLAHELAHIVRADYAAGLLARLALAFHFYHPLVRWMTGRLLAQQELAADALGARFGGGRDSYLLALSRLALRQDERASFWPARAFLPAKGTLIRRIEMLTKMESKEVHSWSLRNRLAAASLLLMVGAGVIALPGPSRGGDEPAPRVALKESTGGVKPKEARTTPAIDLSYLPADARGFIAIQPAAICRREGMDKLLKQLSKDKLSEVVLWAILAEYGLPLPVDQNLVPFRFPIQDVEQIVSHFWIGYTENKKFRRFNQDSFVIRMMDNFDWEGQVRAWWPELTEVNVRGLNRSYFRINQGHLQKLNYCVYIPDGRTMVFDREVNILELIKRTAPAAPRFIQGSDWAQVQRSLFVIAINNKDHYMTEILKTEGGDNTIAPWFRRMFDGAERWIFSLDDTDDLALRAIAACTGPEDNRSTALAAEGLLGLLRKRTENVDGTPRSNAQEYFAKVFRDYEVKSQGMAVDAKTTPAAKIADLFELMAPEFARDLQAVKAMKAAKAK